MYWNNVFYKDKCNEYRLTLTWDVLKWLCLTPGNGVL